MSSKRLIIGAWGRNGVLLVLFLLALTRLLTINWEAVLISSVVELLPQSEEIEQGVSSAIRDAQTGLVFFGGRDKPLSLDQAEALRSAFEGLAGVEATRIGLGPNAEDELGRFFFTHRMALIFPTWLMEAKERFELSGGDSTFEEWLAIDSVEHLDAFLDSPESLGFESLIESDPLLLLPFAMDHFTVPAFEGNSEDTRVWLQLVEDSLNADVQSAMIPQIEEIVSNLGLVDELSWFGALNFAAESRAIMQREVSLLNILTFFFVALIATLVLRRPWQLIHLLVPVLLGLLGGLTVLTLSFDRVHLLSLVLGSILAGVAIDFGVHLFFHSEKRGSGHTVIKALLISGLSTIAGYAVWANSSFMLARQAGVFVASGLSFALLAVMLYTPLRKSVAVRHEGLLCRRLIDLGGTFRWVVFALMGAVIALLWVKVEWDDRLEILDVPHPELDLAVESLSKQGGIGLEGRLVYGTGESYIQAAERIRNIDTETFSLAHLFPSSDAVMGAQHFENSTSAFLGYWREALEIKDFNSKIFADFEKAFIAHLESDVALSATAAGDALGEIFQGPSGALIGSVDGAFWMGALLLEMDTEIPALPEEVYPLEIRGQLEALLASWRAEQWRLSLLGMGVIAVIVMVLFPVRSWLTVISLPVGAVALALGLLSWLMGGLNLFHLAGALLGFCVTLDYVVFFENCRRAEEPFPTSIRFSAMTTIVAFGILILSQVAGVQSLGATVALTVLLSIFGLELIRPAPSKRAG